MGGEDFLRAFSDFMRITAEQRGSRRRSVTSGICDWRLRAGRSVEDLHGHPVEFEGLRILSSGRVKPAQLCEGDRDLRGGLAVGLEPKLRGPEVARERLLETALRCEVLSFGRLLLSGILNIVAEPRASDLNGIVKRRQRVEIQSLCCIRDGHVSI